MRRALRVGVSVAAVFASLEASAQQCGTLTTCPTASTPYSGSELLYMVQNGVSKKGTLGSIVGGSAGSIPQTPAQGFLFTQGFNQLTGVLGPTPGGTVFWNGSGQLQTGPLPASSIPLFSETGVIAGGLSQSAATALSALAYFHQVGTVASAGLGVRLPACTSALARSDTVPNQGASQLAIYPASGDQIGSYGTNNSTTVNAGTTATFACVAAHQWTVLNSYLTASDPIQVDSTGNFSWNPRTPLPNPLLGSPGGTSVAALTFSTPGDLAATYTSPPVFNYTHNFATTCVVASLALASWSYTTASGSLEVTGLPVLAGNWSGSTLLVSGLNVALTAPANSIGIAANVAGNTSVANIVSQRTTSTANWGVANAANLVSAAVVSGGTGYANGDTITLANPSGGATMLAVLTVTNQSGGVIQSGGVSVTTATANAAPPPTTAVSQFSTSGTGTGATFDLTFSLPTINVSGCYLSGS